MASKLRVGAGPSSVDTVSMGNWLLWHGKFLQLLREELTEWTECLCNGTPPFVAYRALVLCRLVALDKEPSVQPLGIGEIWQQAIATCALKVCNKDAKAACDSTHLCADLEADIEGAFHATGARAA